MQSATSTGRNWKTLIAIAALLLVYAIAGTAFAQSPSASAGASASARASVAASHAASPGGAVATGSPRASATQPDTAVAPDLTNDTTAGVSPIAFLLLGIGAVAAVLVYLGMRGSQLRKAPVGSDREPRS